MAEKMATREAYGKALAEFGETYDFVVLDADLAEVFLRKRSRRGSLTAVSRRAI